MQSLKWNESILYLLDQTKLPHATEMIACHDWQRVAEAIKKLEVRGAPAIGAAAAFGMVLGAQSLRTESDSFYERLKLIAAELKKTRPTAINLFWAIDKMLAKAACFERKGLPMAQVIEGLSMEAQRIAEQDRMVNRKIAEYGAKLFTDRVAVLTHCNAGALATVDLGTALGVIRQAHQENKISMVYADETRPLLQGARLTAWELMQDHIPVTLITDSMAGWVMQRNLVKAVIVGADRITLNGDTANKIGTYSLAVLAKTHNIPFYVAAPISTFDFSIASGNDIPIEERNANEITHIAGVQIAPEGINVYNPAFDVTPNELISAIITEQGILTAPFKERIHELMEVERGTK